MDSFDYIYEDEIEKLLISVNSYVSENKVRGVSQMKGRRFGNMWERLVKTAFEQSDKTEYGSKVYYKDFVDKWIDNNTNEIEDDESKKIAKNLLMKFVEETSGTSNQDMCDFTFEKDNVKFAVDTKYRFHSNDAKTVREIADSAPHLIYLGYVPVLLLRTKRKESIKAALDRFERSGWAILCDNEAQKFIEEKAGNELNVWIEKNVDVWKRLKEYQEGLKKLSFGENEWKF